MAHLPEKLPANPLPLLAKWLEDAQADATLPNPDAMALATVGEHGQPSVRIVLCKHIVVEPGYLVFYTNYGSAKAAAIEAHSRVAAVFHWDHLNRQARVEGIAIRSPAAESDSYFATRDKESQVGAWASAQSRPIESRRQLLNKHVATARKLSGLAVDSGIMSVPRHSFWGGYRIWVSAVELWVRGDARLHDRGRWERPLSAADNADPLPGKWNDPIRLQP
jgi:pyridoxamine 5'-phosphate oxidase